MSTGQAISVIARPIFPAASRHADDSNTRTVDRLQLLSTQVDACAKSQKVGPVMTLTVTPEVHWATSTDTLLAELGKVHPYGIEHVRHRLAFQLAKASAHHFSLWTVKGDWKH